MTSSPFPHNLPHVLRPSIICPGESREDKNPSLTAKILRLLWRDCALLRRMHENRLHANLGVCTLSLKCKLLAGLPRLYHPTPPTRWGRPWRAVGLWVHKVIQGGGMQLLGLEHLGLAREGGDPKWAWGSHTENFLGLHCSRQWHGWRAGCTPLPVCAAPAAMGAHTITTEPSKADCKPSCRVAWEMGGLGGWLGGPGM